MLTRIVAVWCLLMMTSALCAQPSQHDLEIAIPETLWGFDGKAVRETFTPLSILIQNHGARNATGTLRLSRQVALETAQEPAVNVPFDIPPFEERWVQTAIYTVDDFAPWQLAWGPRSSQIVELPQPRIGESAIVLLVNPGDRPRPSGALRRFRANLFPATVTMTDGLDAVFMNDAPDFQGARLQAFLEWLHRGGRVVLLHGDDQKFPQFSSALAVLNNPANRFPVGGGRVMRLPLEAGDVDETQLRNALASNDQRVSRRETATAFEDPTRTYNGRYPWGRDRNILEKLERASRFHRRWWLIYPLALLYLLAIFPGSFVVSQAPRGVRHFYIAYFATAIAFSWAFKSLGGVGGGDRNRIRSATIAHQLSPGVFDCSQWSSLAAVDGGRYSLRHDGSGRLYTHVEEFETPHGQITTGSEAGYEVDIPVASTRTAVSRFRATAPPVLFDLQSAEFVDQKLNRCTVTPKGLAAKPLEVLVAHRDVILRLQEGAGSWASDRRRSMSTSVFITSLDHIPNFTLAARNKPATDEFASQDLYRSLERALVGNAFQTRGHVDPASAILPPGVLRVMALVEADQAFAGSVPDFEDLRGCVLYVVDLPVTEN